MKANRYSVHFVALLIAITTALTQPLFAQAVPTPTPHVLKVTENSSTNLTATYDGMTSRVSVQSNGTDDWLVDVFSASVENIQGTSWMEPSGSDVNTIALAFDDPFRPGVVDLEFRSDNSITSGSPLANGAPLMFAGIDLIDGGNINITFIDNGDVATTPDTGSTLGLLALALAALFGASRLRSIQLA